MAIDFDVDDIIHQIAAKFIPAYLPEARKAFYLKAAVQPEIDVHGIASKASVYNISTPPKVIEEGLLAGLKIIAYLAADGFRVVTPLFTMRVRIPGEYHGTEDKLPDEIRPEIRIQPTAKFHKYSRENIEIEIIGKVSEDGAIDEALDTASGLIDEAATMGAILTIRGRGLKIGSEPANETLAGVYFVPKDGGFPTKVKSIAVNEPRTLKVVVPLTLTEGKEYFIGVDTWTGVKNTGTIMKNVRNMQSDFTVTAQKEA